jgi:2-polyprenyl-3-methyl-5-hydroxy-6-metoxy-1,4-benzoquinol methylase
LGSHIPATVLEIGCGMGLHSELMARAGARLHSIDLSPTSVEATQRRFALKHLDGNIQQADAERLPFFSEKTLVERQGRDGAFLFLEATQPD